MKKVYLPQIHLLFLQLRPNDGLELLKTFCFHYGYNEKFSNTLYRKKTMTVVYYINKYCISTSFSKINCLKLSPEEINQFNKLFKE